MNTIEKLRGMYAVVVATRAGKYIDGESSDDAAVECDMLFAAKKLAGIEYDNQIPTSERPTYTDSEWERLVTSIGNVIMADDALKYATEVPAFVCPDTAKKLHDDAMAELRAAVESHTGPTLNELNNPAK